MDWFKVVKSAFSDTFAMYQRGLGIKQKEQTEQVQSVPRAWYRGKVAFALDGRRKVYMPAGEIRHKVIRGASGAGKTIAMASIFREWVLAANGGCWVDNTDGEIALQIIQSLPDEQLNRVVLIDHSDKYNPVGIAQYNVADNMFNVDSQARQWVEFFESQFDVESQYMTQQLIKNSCKAVFALPGHTIIDVINFVTNEQFRQYVLGKLDHTKYADVLTYWSQFNAHSDVLRVAQSFLRRADQVQDDILRLTLGQMPKTPLKYRQWMDEDKIVIIRVPESLGALTVRVIVSLHVSGFWQAVLSREDIPKTQRRPFVLVADEPQTWLAKNEDTLDEMFSKARKYGLEFWMLYQSDSQVKKRASSNMVNIIYDNEPDLLEFLREPKYCFNATIDGHRPFLLKSLGLLPVLQSDISQFVTDQRSKYNRPWQEVDTEIRRRAQIWAETQNVSLTSTLSKSNRGLLDEI